MLIHLKGLIEARATWAERNPMGRMGTPSELTGAVVLLSSNAGTYLNGKFAPIPGFYVLH